MKTELQAEEHCWQFRKISRAGDRLWPPVEFWIQIENHGWDASPHRLDRMTGQDFNTGSVTVNLTSPVTSARTGVRMYKPLMSTRTLTRGSPFILPLENGASRKSDQRVGE
jgi:hypothetical protein